MFYRGYPINSLPYYVFQHYITNNSLVSKLFLYGSFIKKEFVLVSYVCCIPPSTLVLIAVLVMEK